MKNTYVPLSETTWTLRVDSGLLIVQHADPSGMAAAPTTVPESAAPFCVELLLKNAGLRPSVETVEIIKPNIR